MAVGQLVVVVGTAIQTLDIYKYTYIYIYIYVFLYGSGASPGPPSKPIPQDRNRPPKVGNEVLGRCRAMSGSSTIQRKKQPGKPESRCSFHGSCVHTGPGCTSRPGVTMFGNSRRALRHPPSPPVENFGPEAVFKPYLKPTSGASEISFI